MSTGKASRRKGAAGEKELAARLDQDGHPVVWGGNRSYGEKPDLSGLTGIHIECKRVERLNIYSAMVQAQRDSERFKDGYPTVFQRRNREEWLVTMHLPDWLVLYDGWRALLDHHRNARAPFLCGENPPFPPLPAKSGEPKETGAPGQIREKRPTKESTTMKPKYWENEQPIRADSGKNILEYYPKGAALSICKPNWEKDGKVYRGKSVALDLDSLRSCPEAVKILQDIVARFAE